MFFDLWIRLPAVRSKVRDEVGAVSIWMLYATHARREWKPSFGGLG